MQVQAISTNQNYNKYKTPSFKEMEEPIRERVAYKVAPYVKKKLTSLEKTKEQFFEYFTKHNVEGDIIVNAFGACLNSDGTINKYALKTIYALFNNRYANLWDNIKSLKIRKKAKKDREKGKRTGLDIVAKIVNACRNRGGEYDKGNLKFAQDLYLLSRHVYKYIPQIINAIKPPDGIITAEDIVFYEYINKLYPQYLMSLIDVMPDKDGNVSESVRNFVKQLGESTEVHWRTMYAAEVLKATQKVENRDEILDFISENDYLKQERPFVDCYTDKDNNINLDYLKNYLEVCESEDCKDFEFSIVPTDIYYTDSPEKTEANIRQLKRIGDYHKSCKKYNSKYFKNDGVINPKYVDLIVTNKNILTESYNTRIHDFIDVAIEAAAQKDGEFNLEVASMLLNFAYAIIPDNIRKIADKDIIRMLQQAAYLCRDSNGDFSKSNIIETMKDLNYVKDNYRRTYNFQQKQCENYLMKKYFDKITEGKNLYDAQVVYDILETANLDFKTLTAEIQDYDNLLFVIANIPPEQNPEVYQKIIEKLNSLESVDYNITDSYDMSFLGKVLCSENLQLLKVISHPLNAPLEYCPELDNMYQGIQNQEFKNFVDNHLELRFPLLEDAVRDCSKKALKKLLPQLSSPLCHRKKVLNDLWKIALGTKDNDFCLYFAKKFSKDLPDSIINDLNKIN